MGRQAGKDSHPPWGTAGTGPPPCRHMLMMIGLGTPVMALSPLLECPLS